VGKKHQNPSPKLSQKKITVKQYINIFIDGANAYFLELDQIYQQIHSTYYYYYKK